MGKGTTGATAAATATLAATIMIVAASGCHAPTEDEPMAAWKAVPLTETVLTEGSDATTDLGWIAADDTLAPGEETQAPTPGDDEAESADGSDATCSVETCAEGASADGQVFEWDGNGNGIPEIYAIDALRDEDGSITGYRLHTTCKMDYDGTLRDAKAILSVDKAEDEEGRLLAISYERTDGGTGRATVRVVGDNIEIQQEG